MNNDLPARVNGQRLWSSLMEMAAIGATDAGGCNRLALTDEDRRARDLFIHWCAAEHCAVRVDQMGNIFARREGTQAGLPPIISGSHLDTQRTGGRFDGVYGVLAAVEVIRTLNDLKIGTRHPVEAVVWSNEEGARFSPAMIGSGTWAGAYDLDFGHSRTDTDGVRFDEALRHIGYLGDHPCVASSVKAAFEVHIEQGPLLEAAGNTIGVLTGIQGVRWYEIVIDGKSSHAGTTPMDTRRDPVVALGAIIDQLFRLAAEHAPHARLTIGRLNAEPGAYNTVPARVTAGIDLRHPDQETLDLLHESVSAIVSHSASEHRVEGHVRAKLDHAPVAFDPECIGVVQRSVDRLGYRSMRMVSGAAHDSMHTARVAPTGMIFVPCKGGLSHHPDEMAKPEDLEAGCNVLLHTILEVSAES